MSTPQIRQELLNVIESADNRLIKILYAVAREYTEADYTLPGEPMTEEIFKERIRAAKSRIRSGQFTTQEDLEKEMKQW